MTPTELTDKEMLEPLRDFLLTYPYKSPTLQISIDYGKVEKTGSNRAGEGNALRLVSRVDLTPRPRKNVLGRLKLPPYKTERINFVLAMKRDANDGDIRREVSEFILQFIQWVNVENSKRGTMKENPKLPHFSDTAYETLSADGGGQVQTLPNERAEFQIALHIDLQTSLQRKE